MATLERTRNDPPPPSLSFSHPPALSSTSSAFLPSAVPTAFAPPQPIQQQHDEDLIDLGEEQLFAGTRGSRARTPEVQVQLEGASVEGAATEWDGEASQELLGSLGAARQAFLFALQGLLQQYFPASGTGSPIVTAVDPFAEPSSSSSLSPPPHQSSSAALPSVAPGATPHPSDLLVSTILDTLRCASGQPLSTSSTHPTSSPAMLSIERSSPLLPRSLTPTPTLKPAALIEELQIRVEVVAADLPRVEADLARSLASLLTCIERLSTISRHEDDGAALTALSNATHDEAPVNVYETLEREASALQARRDLQESEAELVVGAVREVEHAERELLWGRVGDLSERVKQLSRQRAATLAEAEQEEGRPVGSEGEVDEKRDVAESPRSHTESIYEPSLSDLPRYSHEHDSQQHQPSHLPPAYFHDYAPDEKESLDWDVKPPRSPSLRHLTSSAPASATTSVLPSGITAPVTTNTRTLKPPAVTEKMQRDLDSVTEAIERLYVVSPQLANQRVEPDQRRQRERQLAKLGNAIERLSQGRLEDQRAVPSPMLGEEAVETHAQRRRREQAALDRMLDQIDRAASRTLADQRVELNGKRKEVLNSETANPIFQPADKYEARRREYILSHTGKGRLAGQDAMLNPSHTEPFPAPPIELSEPVTIHEFFAEPGRERERSLSLPDTALASSSSSDRKKSSNRTLFQAKVTAPGQDESQLLGAPGKKASLRMGVFKRTGAGIRRGSYDASGMTGLGVFGSGTSMSRSASTTEIEVLATPQFDWVTEESRNLGTLIVTFWSRVGTSYSRDDEYEVLSVEVNTILVAPTRGGPASRLTLPCRVIPQQPKVESSGNVHRIKLITNNPSPTKSRADLEIHTPLSTEDLRRSMPTSFACSTCNAELADVSSLTRYNALPSEHWAELLDAWMCHGDQELNADLIAKGKGIKPRVDEGLVGTSYVLLGSGLTKNWVTPEGSEPTRSPSDDLLYPAHCTSCSSLIGSHVLPLHPSTSDSAPTTFRLLKYATYPLRRLTSQTIATGEIEPPRYSLASFLTAEMLETGQAHACHRFVLEDVETEQARLLLWFFNPAVRLSFSTSSPMVDILGAPSSSTSADVSPTSSPAVSSSISSAKLFGRSMNAVKVFYAVVAGDSDPRCADFLEVKSERMPYPRNVLDRVTDLLRASTLVYPASKRKWTHLDVGFLERI